MFPRRTFVRIPWVVRAVVPGIFSFSMAWAMGTATAASLESAQMGAPGQIGGVSIASGQPAVGWRFEVSVPFQVQRIGGHLLSIPDHRPIYGAIIALDSITSLPVGAPFHLDEMVASTTFVPPSPSDEIILPFAATLAPGAYALLFGTDYLGVTGIGALPNSSTGQPDIPPTTIDSYMVYGIPRPGASHEWREGLGSHMRMIVRGTTVGLTADFDIDGVVDASDRVLWEASFGVNAMADANDNGLSEGSDFLAWQRQRAGDGASLATSRIVPEPSAVMMGMLAWCVYGIHGVLAAFGREPPWKSIRRQFGRRSSCGRGNETLSSRRERNSTVAPNCSRR